MTKAQMIEKIQVAEAKAWKEYLTVKDIFGKDDEMTKRHSRAWTTIDNLREEMGIERMTAKRLFELELI
jgi:hypothetical protein